MLIVIVGPTGSGKTSSALKLADFYHAPIINADAFQIYQDMNIGTAKIEVGSSDYKKHYLLDIVKPNQTYSVKQYQEDFRKTYQELKKQYDNIVVCGGTGLYIKAALYDYAFQDEENTDISDLEALSNEELFEKLKEIDPKATLNIHMNNRKRVLRALQIARTHDVKKSDAIDAQNHDLIYPNEDIKFYFINPDRDALYENINKRVDSMFDNGLVDEVKSLLNAYTLSLTAKAAIGYKEVIDYLDNKCSLEECKELVKKRSRNYAKRQVTFFKHQLPCKEYVNCDELIKELINE